MNNMNQLEKSALRMKELQPRIPSWAKLEKMEINTPQIELWKYADDSNRVLANRLISSIKRTICRLFFRK